MRRYQFCGTEHYVLSDCHDAIARVAEYKHDPQEAARYLGEWLDRARWAALCLKSVARIRRSSKGAERTRRWRQKRQAENPARDVTKSVTQNVTESVTCDGAQDADLFVSQGSNSLSQSELIESSQPDTSSHLPADQNEEARARENKAVTRKRHKSNVTREQAREVFEHWAKEFGQGTKVDNKRLARIASRIREGYTVEQLTRVLDGVKRSPWNMGENPSGEMHTGVLCVYRDAQQVDRFLKLASGSPPVPQSGFIRIPSTFRASDLPGPEVLGFDEDGNDLERAG